jgi:hypothetical protein
MAVDTAAQTRTLKLTDDLAVVPARGVERAVDASSFREAADLLLVPPSAVEGRDVEVWLLRIGAHAVSALVAERDADAVTITRIAPGHAEPLLQAVLGHYALEGVEVAHLPS